jgi:hypothetical protein
VAILPQLPLYIRTLLCHSSANFVITQPILSFRSEAKESASAFAFASLFLPLLLHFFLSIPAGNLPLAFAIPHCLSFPKGICVYHRQSSHPTQERPLHRVPHISLYEMWVSQAANSPNNQANPKP